jgi:hypothetical protein
VETREFICEVCDKTETLADEAAFQAGWDYPPFIGVAGVVSPRTCGDCGMESTVWWALMTGAVTVDTLSDRQKATVNRILAEV